MNFMPKLLKNTLIISHISKLIRIMLKPGEEKPIIETPIAISVFCIGRKNTHIRIEYGKKKGKLSLKTLDGGETIEIEPGSFYSITNTSAKSTFVSLTAYKAKKIKSS